MRGVLLVLSAALTFAKGYEAAADRIDITNAGPIFQSGYASRTHPSTAIRTRLWAKSLAIRDETGNGVLIITTDLIGLPRAITDVVSARLEINHSISRSRIVFNSSHTHSGPFVRANLPTMFQFKDDERAIVDQYAQDLIEKLVSVASAALAKMSPATLTFGEGEALFAANRRTPPGPVDHSVPVLRVKSINGNLIAILAGYACHNTTLTGEFYQISGDYAGYAQSELEAVHPGTVALFLMLCGGDQNPQPRSTVELAEQHGRALAASVNQVLSQPMKPVTGRIHTALEQTRLTFAFHSRADFEAQLNSKNPSEVRRAKLMLKRYDEGDPVRDIPYPVQAIAFGKSLTLLALGGEVVVDYALRVKKENPATNLIVAGYSNDVMCYIPSLRILKEGGYEAKDSMIYYGQPGPFADDVEERVFDAIHRVLKRVDQK